MQGSSPDPQRPWSYRCSHSTPMWATGHFLAVVSQKFSKCWDQVDPQLLKLPKPVSKPVWKMSNWGSPVAQFSVVTWHLDELWATSITCHPNSYPQVTWPLKSIVLLTAKNEQLGIPSCSFSNFQTGFEIGFGNLSNWGSTWIQHWEIFCENHCQKSPVAHQGVQWEHQ